MKNQFITEFYAGDHEYAGSEENAYPRAWRGKRLFDLICGLLLLPILLPIIAILCVIVSLDGEVPILGHRRVGKGGREFRCWKIRSMVVDAEERLKKHLAENPEAATEWQLNYKLAKDPRITRLGRFLRKSSLDELPQLFNVFRGEMSFVGPRPVVPAELERYGLMQKMYKNMRPGVTGLWQVSGRNDVSYDERIAMDAQYAQNNSFFEDIRIVGKTVASVVGLTGK